ncbi:MAG: EamA family transporter [Candidatus Omnitrophota bacterium]
MSAYTWAILAAVIWGFVPLLEKAGLGSVRPLAGLFYRSIGVIIGIILLGLFFVKPQELQGVDWRSRVYLVLAGFLASFVAQIFFYHGLKIGEISRVVPISGSYPLIAFMLGILLLGESVNPVKLAGAVLVVIGLCVLRVG